MPLIELNDLKTYFYTEDGVVQAVNGVSFSIDKQETLGVVGESGCGKSVTALSIMGLVPMPPGKIEAGEIIYHRNGNPVDLTQFDPKGREMRSIRGDEIAMIFQEPMTSLNPVFTIGNQIIEAITLHQDVNKQEARRRAITMLDEVGIPLPDQRVDEYPHQLSGGMRQRAMIAMALSCNPTMLIADEPTTALDVTIQAQILELMADLQDEFHTAIMFITHDLGVIAEITNFVVVMYMGKIAETGDVHEIYNNPKHPYTQGLMKSIPALDVSKGRLNPIEGVVPDPYNIPDGCPFNTRCPEVMNICRQKVPPLEEVASEHNAACWLHIDH